MTARYQTPAAFRTALEQRQKQRANLQGVTVDRLAKVDLYFRFLARVVRELGDGAVVVKGGVALEMRLQRARTTLDIDLRALGAPAEVYQRIRAAGLVDLGDFLTFQVEDHVAGADLDGDGVIYEGRRFQVQAMLANRPYRHHFGLDVVFGDPMVGDPETLLAPDAMSFLGIDPPAIPIYPLATHLAEKLHAYTLPRLRPNSRMKDLVDIALVATEPDLKPSSATISAGVVFDAMQRTFAARNTHDLPRSLPPAPPAWTARYPREQRINGHAWVTIDAVHADAARFLDPVLQGAALGRWNALARAWAP
jgi:hypothetical protein